MTMLRKWVGMAALALAAALLAAPAAHAQRITVDRVQIVVDDRMLTSREVAEYRQVKLAQLKAAYSGAELERHMATLDQEVADELINRLLLENRAHELKISVSDEELESRINAITSRDPTAAQQYSDVQLKEYVLEELLTRRVLQREVYSKIFVPNDQVLAECQRMNKDTREIDVGHILIRGDGPEALARMQAIRERLLAGEDFEKLASEVSQDPAVTRNKGRLGFIGRGQFVKPFEDAAFGLPVGQISEPVHTQFGYHVIKVFGQRVLSGIDCANLPASEQEKIRERLGADSRGREMEAYFKKLRREADIRVLKP